MTDEQLQAAADLLWRHWQEGRRLGALPPGILPTSRAEGYAVQALVEPRSRAPLFGWKIAATSAAGQAHINVDGPLAGRLLREKAIDSGAELPFGANHMRVAEAEFAFRMGRDLPPRETAYDVAEVMAAVDTLHPAIEVPDSRYDDFTAVGAAQLIADNACAHLFVLGPPTAAAWRDMDLVEHPVTATVSGAVTATVSGSRVPSLRRDGKGANVLGDPRVALAWLVNELSGLGIAVKAGEVVTTGTCVVPVPIAPGDTVTADFGVFGAVTARIV